MASRYKSLFPFVRGGLSFFTSYPEDQDLASIIPKKGMRNGERYAYAHYATALSHDLFDGTFSTERAQTIAK